MERHFTATVYIFYEDKVLLHLHPKFGKWLPPGGHVERNETPFEAAVREAKEETGLDLVFIEQENLKIDAYNATSFPRPFLCLLENLPEYKGKPAHQHMDMIYIARPVEGTAQLIAKGFRWFSYEELREFEEELFPDAKEILRLLLKERRYRNEFISVSTCYQRR